MQARAFTRFADDHARIVAELPIELPVADVERDDVARAALQQDVGEAAGGGADIERAAALDVDVERVERVRELDAAAADVGMVGRGQLDAASLADRRAGFRHDVAVDAHLAGENQRARPFARRRQPALDESGSSRASSNACHGVSAAATWSVRSVSVSAAP